MDQKVFVIGLDGATFDLIQPWVEAGKLPVFDRLIQEGISGPLSSTFPPLTGPAWSSFMTGKSPAQHGVLEFFRRQEGSYRQVLNNRQDIDGKSLWRCLSEGGKSVGVMGVPLTYPPEKVNGFIITGLLTPPGRRDFTYPLDLLNEIETQVGKYCLRHDEKYRSNNPFPFLKEQFHILENNTQAALYLMTHKKWDFFMVHFLGTDRIQHELWHTLDPNHPKHDPAEVEKLGEVFENYFKRVDEAIGRLIEAVDDETAVIIMSDHGFGPVYKFINFNTWLLKEGLLCLKRNPQTILPYLLFKLGFNYTVCGNLILKLGLGKQTVRMGRAKREIWQRRIFLSLKDVDWTKSKVYSMGNFGQLYVNLKGREPNGIISPGDEYETVIQDLIQRLEGLVDPENGEAVIEKIVRREQVYQGNYTERAPDLMFFTRDMKYKAMGLSDFSSNKVFEPVFGSTGHHRMNGIFIGYKPGVFKEHAQLGDARIYDLAPTILYLMGQKIPSDMDGQVLLHSFTTEYRQLQSIHFQEDLPFEGDEDETKLTELEESVLAEMLRSLGYVN
jgi:predicted AlkP superfamily phosphohydrolase/phosphomutase